MVLNILSAHSDLEKTLLSSDLVAVFRRLSTSWGDQMNAVLGNALLAFLESKEGGTLLDLRRFLIEREFRTAFLRSVQDPEVVYFWEKEFPLLIGRAASPLLTRLDTFLRPKIIRNIVAQNRSLDFREIIDGGKVLLAKLPHGAIGEENSELLGSLLVSKFHQVALSRQDVEKRERKEFHLTIDEFHHFATPSMVSLLSGVRKYGLGLTLAHQNLSQLGSTGDSLLGSVLANASTRICFRLGDQDAKRLAEGFSFFEARDLQNLGVGEAIVRIDRTEHDFNLRTEQPGELDPGLAAQRYNEVLASSRELYATPKADLAQVDLPPSLSQRDEPEREQPVTVTDIPEPITIPEVRAPRRASVDGRGGQQHRYLQTLLKRLGEEAGFRASLEVPVLSGTGNVDVVLEREDLRIACEITVTTPTGHEAGNLQKCLAAGFGHVVLISPAQRNLDRVRKRCAEVFSADQLSRIHFTLPERIAELLSQLSAPAQKIETVKGYKVRVKFAAPPSDDVKRIRLDTVRDVIGGSLKRKL